MRRDSFAFRLRGIEPKDATFRSAGEEVHRAFWRFIAAEGVTLFRQRCERGLDRHGSRVYRISAATRTKGPDRSYPGLGEADEPLVPAHGLSRTEDLLRGRGFSDHAEWHWVTDPHTGLHWGRVLHWHRIGARQLPVRDVIGWSVEDRLELARRGQEWWHHWQTGKRLARAAMRAELPAPKTGTPMPPKIPLVGRTDL
jgi:hypothetical protein